MAIDLETGHSDEGDPWAAFENRETGDIVVHIARIDGLTIVVNTINGKIYRGQSFRDIADQFLGDSRLALPVDNEKSNVVLHPRSLFSVFVFTAILMSDFIKSPAFASSTVSRHEHLHSETFTLKLFDTNSSAREYFQVSTSWPLISGATLAGMMMFGGYRAEAPIPMISLPGSNVVWSPSDESATNERDIITISSLPDIVANDSGGSASLRDYADLISYDLIDGKLTISLHSIEYHSKSIPINNPLSLDAMADHPNIIFNAALSGYDMRLYSVDPPYSVHFDNVQSDISAGVIRGQSENEINRVSAAIKETEIKSNGGFYSLVFGPLDNDNVIIVDGLRGSDEGVALLKGEDLGALGPDREEVGINKDIKDDSGTDIGYASYQLASELSPEIILTDQTDIVAYVGGNVEIYGFQLGQDRLVFIEQTAPADWIQSIELIGNSLIFLGVGGATVTLHDVL